MLIKLIRLSLRYFGSVQEALKDSRFQAAYAKLHTEPAAEKINEFQAIARYEYALPEDVTQELIAEAQASARPDFSETEGVSEAGISENLSAAPRPETNTAGEQTGNVGFSLTPPLAEPPSATIEGRMHYYLHRSQGGNLYNNPQVAREESRSGFHLPHV